jgi:hypothetical protein
MEMRSNLIVSVLLFVFAQIGAVEDARAACPSQPLGVVLPSETIQPVDLEREFEHPWQAGGRIVVFCAPDGTPRAGRVPDPPADAAEEKALRAEHFALARRMNFARKGEAHPLGLPLAKPQTELLERFALSDAGAVWLREVADDTLRLLNKGYLNYDKALWKKSVAEGKPPRLSSLLTGRLSEKGQFAGDARVFLFSGYAGPGAMAHAGAIGLGDAGLRCQFPSSGELVDPFAVISHEFGHTRYGDPASSGTLLGEARTVERYENPVRLRNGYELRTLYFQRTAQGGLEARKDSLLDRLLKLEREKGISVADMTAVERYHCDCFGPLPVILDCEVRERPGANGIQEPASEHDCKLHWKPDSMPVPPLNPLLWKSRGK